MSRHSNSSEKKHGRSAGTSNSEELIEYSKYLVDQLNTVVHDNPSDWETHLDSARSVIATLENIRFFRGSSRFVEQVWLLNGLQDFSFHDPDSGFIQDIADWCRSAWLQILRNYPDNTEVLAGEFLLTCMKNKSVCFCVLDFVYKSRWIFVKPN